jgi:hypothetical protein
MLRYVPQKTKHIKKGLFQKQHYSVTFVRLISESYAEVKWYEQGPKAADEGRTARLLINQLFDAFPDDQQRVAANAEIYVDLSVPNEDLAPVLDFAIEIDVIEEINEPSWHLQQRLSISVDCSCF